MPLKLAPFCKKKKELHAELVPGIDHQLLKLLATVHRISLDTNRVGGKSQDIALNAILLATVHKISLDTDQVGGKSQGIALNAILLATVHRINGGQESRHSSQRN